MPPKLRTPLIILGAIVLLASAAFVGLSLLNPNLANSGSLPVPGAATNSSGKMPGVTFDVIPATEIPATNPDLVGRLQNRQDNSLMVLPDTKGAPALVVEVVITTQTRLYRNTTGDQLHGAPPSGTTIRMVVVPYTLEQVAAGNTIITWGERRGDRIVAEVIMVEPQTASAAPVASPETTAQAP
jgi:hypothetical protein